MSNKINTVNAYLAAIQSKDVEKAVGCYAEGATVEAPNGTQTGKAQIRDMLSSLVARPAPTTQFDVAEEGGQVVVRGGTPTGVMVMRFTFDGDLISKQTVGMQ